MVILQPSMIGPPSTITPPETTRRRKRSRSEEDGLQRPFEDDAFKENGTFTPAVLLLYQNGDGSHQRAPGDNRLVLTPNNDHPWACGPHQRRAIEYSYQAMDPACDEMGRVAAERSGQWWHV